MVCNELASDSVDEKPNAAKQHSKLRPVELQKTIRPSRSRLLVAERLQTPQPRASTRPIPIHVQRMPESIPMDS